MNLQESKILILVVTAILALVVASPALQKVLVYPQTEFFTEMWLLGPEHNAENYPTNITRSQNYKVFLGISNHLDYCAYYKVEVKFRTAKSQPVPDTSDRTPSSLPSLYSLGIVVADKETGELPLTFSFDYSYDPKNSRVNYNHMDLNGGTMNLDGYSSSWDKDEKSLFGNLIFELWIYNESVGSFTYHERFNDLKFNMQV